MSQRQMIPTFTIVSTLVTIGVTALLIGVLVRINNPQHRRPRGRDDGGAPIVADGGGSSRRQDADHDSSDGDGGGDGGGGD
jgi:hypothetical protein